MDKGKDIRIIVILECTYCVRKGVNKNHRAFLDILLKRIDTIHPIDENLENFVTIVKSI